MKRFICNEELEALCEAVVKDFFRKKHYTNSLCVDIEALVSEYLGSPVLYEAFAEEDPNRIGFLSDGERPLLVRRENAIMQLTFPLKTIVVEKYLLHPRESARRRFTIAHEAGHLLLLLHIPIQASPVAAFHGEFDDKMGYTKDTLQEMFSLNECLANRAGACLLMPRFLVLRVLKRFNAGRKVILYNGAILSQDQKLLVQRMADAMGVSYTAFFNRLRELGLFEHRAVEEYLHHGLGFGGV